MSEKLTEEELAILEGRCALAETRGDDKLSISTERIYSLLQEVREARAEKAQRLARSDLGEPCVGCGKRSSISTAGCGHCDYEDK